MKGTKNLTKYIVLFSMALLIMLISIILCMKAFENKKDKYIKEQENLIKSQFNENKEIYDNLISAMKNLDFPKKSETYDYWIYTITQKESNVFISYKDDEILVEDELFIDRLNKYNTSIEHNTKNIMITKHKTTTNYNEEIISFIYPLDSQGNYFYLKLLYCEEPLTNKEKLFDNWYFEIAYSE